MFFEKFLTSAHSVHNAPPLLRGCGLGVEGTTKGGGGGTIPASGFPILPYSVGCLVVGGEHFFGDVRYPTWEGWGFMTVGWLPHFSSLTVLWGCFGGVVVPFPWYRTGWVVLLIVLPLGRLPGDVLIACEW